MSIRHFYIYDTGKGRFTRRSVKDMLFLRNKFRFRAIITGTNCALPKRLDKYLPFTSSVNDRSRLLAINLDIVNRDRIYLSSGVRGNAVYLQDTTVLTDMAEYLDFQILAITEPPFDYLIQIQGVKQDGNVIF